MFVITRDSNTLMMLDTRDGHGKPTKQKKKEKQRQKYAKYWCMYETSLVGCTFKIYSDGEKKKILGVPPCNIWIIIFG